MGLTEPRSLVAIVSVCLFGYVEAFDLEKRTELYIGIGAGLGGLILGVLLVIIALLCRKYLVNHNGKRSRRKYKPDYREMENTETSLYRNTRASNYRNSISVNSHNDGPMSFENNAFVIAETSFKLPRTRPGSVLSSPMSDSISSQYSLSRNSSFISNKSQVSHNYTAARQQNIRDFNMISRPLTPNHQTERNNLLYDREKANVHFFRNNNDDDRYTMDQPLTDRDSWNRYSINARNNDGSLQHGPMRSSSRNARDNDGSLQHGPMRSSSRDIALPLSSEIDFNVPGNRSSYISLLSTGEMSHFSLPRLSVRRSEQFVDVTGENPGFTPFPD